MNVYWLVLTEPVTDHIRSYLGLLEVEVLFESTITPEWVRVFTPKTVEELDKIPYVKSVQTDMRDIQFPAINTHHVHIDRAFDTDTVYTYTFDLAPYVHTIPEAHQPNVTLIENQMARWTYRTTIGEPNVDPNGQGIIRRP